MFLVVFRFSFLSCVLSDAINDRLTYPLAQYVVNSKWDAHVDKLHACLSELPLDYNGDNYDLIFDANYNYIRAERSLENSEKLRESSS